MSAIRCVPDLGHVADGEEDRRLGERMHGHVQEAGEIGERTAHAECKGDDAHMLDRRVGEQPLDVAPAVEHERGEYERDQSERHHQRAGASAAAFTASSILKRSSA
jgi:hypothetical protein